MSSEAFVRTLHINPEVFRYPATRASRKKNQVQVQGQPPIRIKQAKPQVTLKRSKLLQQMRRIQQDRLQQDPATKQETASTSEEIPPRHAFQEALQYLEQHSNEPKPPQKQESPLLKNRTLKKDEPQYGCLKNGNKPCFRTWMQRTQRQVGGNQEEPKEAPQQNLNAWLESKLRLRQTRDKERSNQETIPQKYRLRRQKRTLRRTFRLGKKRHGNEVAVLVANKTLRQKTQTKINALRQVSLDDVRKVLIQKGLIKIGSAAPSDVLRKMYESVSLMCGDVTNHNGDNLVYNYFNGKPE